jgi:hypothetical protein
MGWEYSSFVVGEVDKWGDALPLVCNLNGKAWDYVLIPLTAQDLLNMMGREGWELVSSHAQQVSEGSDVRNFSTYTLRREYHLPSAQQPSRQA